MDNVYTLDNFGFTLDNYNNNFKRALESLRTRDNFNFTNFLINGFKQFFSEILIDKFY